MNLKRLLFSALFLSSISSLAFAQTVTLKTLYSFLPTDGNEIQYGLVQAGDGDFYGTSISGGAYNNAPAYGTVFKISADGTFTLLHTFTGLEDGAYPYGPLVVARDGNLYGVTDVGGGASGPVTCDNDDSNCGTIFKITPSGTLTTLHSFTRTIHDGGIPAYGLALGGDGNFYGATLSGGTYDYGTFFRLTPSGTLTNLYTFDSSHYGPTNALVQGSDGAFYGAAVSGGAFGLGSVVRLTTDGTYTLLHAFSGADGAVPYAPLIESSDGNFYSTTAGLQMQCANNPPPSGSCGNVFKISPAGDFTVLYTFSGGSDGSQQGGPLFQAGDGNFYGTNTAAGNLNACPNPGFRPGCGTIFRLTPAGSLTTIHQFDGTTYSYGGLIQSGSGKFYGTTSYTNTIYSLSSSKPIPAPVQLSLSQSQITAGLPATISWQVLNAFSLSMQQCFGFQTVGAVTVPLGKQSGAYSDSTKLFTGSSTFTPAVGTYTYALTCGGQESGFATLSVLKAPTSTILAASPASVTRPGSSLLTATVARSTSGAEGTPSGSVTFYADDRYFIGTAKLNSAGVATIDPSSAGVAPGSYSITAKYSGDASDTASTSSPVTVTVQ